MPSITSFYEIRGTNPYRRPMARRAKGPDTSGAGRGARAADKRGMRIATRRPFTFTTVNVNVKSNPTMPQRSVVHDVKRASQTGSLIGWNEIGPGRYFDALKQLGPEWGHSMPHDGKLHIPNPISWKKSEWKQPGQEPAVVIGNTDEDEVRLIAPSFADLMKGLVEEL